MTPEPKISEQNFNAIIESIKTSPLCVCLLVGLFIAGISLIVLLLYLKKRNIKKVSPTPEGGILPPIEPRVPGVLIDYGPPEEVGIQPQTTDTSRPNVTTGVDIRTGEIKKPLPPAKPEPPKPTEGLLRVNYMLSIPESIDNYAIIRIPKKECVVRSYRDGITKRRGVKEESFENSIQRHFGKSFTVSGNVRLNTGQDIQPYEPDIAIIGKGPENIRIDVEIDEPYAGITRQSTHCKGDDTIRDIWFTDRGWIVIRFSEYQVHTQELSCLKFIAQVLSEINGQKYVIPVKLSNAPDLRKEAAWDIVQAQKWEKERYREKYLNHEFGEVPEIEETTKRGLNPQEGIEEENVIQSFIGNIDTKKAEGYNNENAHLRDCKIKFYPEPHAYTIDGVSASSASTVISRFFPEFDAYEKACNLSQNNPLYGLPPEEIMEIWRQRGIDAANCGTYLHEQIEKYYLKKPFQEPEEFRLFRRFVDDHPSLEPFRSEWRIFDESHRIAGTIDLIVKNGNGLDIYDWKRSEKIVDANTGLPITVDTWGKRGVGGLSDISDTSYNRYCLQQSLYRYILEKNYGISILNMYLVVLHPKYDRYYKVEVPYMKDKIEYILKTLHDNS